MDEVWSEDGRRFDIYEDKGQPAEWSDESIPQPVTDEVPGGWGWRIAVRSKDGRGRFITPDQLDSGPVYYSREAARDEAKAVRVKRPDLSDLPLVDWLTGDSLEVEDEDDPESN